MRVGLNACCASSAQGQEGGRGAGVRGCGECMAVRMGFRVAGLANEAREGALHAICAACRG